MKIRNGFVSNSSTASFVVIVYDDKQLLDDYIIKTLTDYGFTWTWNYFPVSYDTKDSKERIDEPNLCYDVICNEKDTIDWLLKNKIPFTASCHYDQYVIKYDGKDEVLLAYNYGNSLLLMRSIPYQFLDKNNIKQFTVKEYLEKE